MVSTVESRECILLLASRIELRAVVTERFMWSSAGNTLHDCFPASTVMMSLFRTLRAHLSFPAVERFVPMKKGNKYVETLLLPLGVLSILPRSNPPYVSPGQCSAQQLSLRQYSRRIRRAIATTVGNGSIRVLERLETGRGGPADVNFASKPYVW